MESTPKTISESMGVGECGVQGAGCGGKNLAQRFPSACNLHVDLTVFLLVA